MNDYQKRSAALQDEIFREDYYSERYKRILARRTMTVEDLAAGKYPPEELQMLWGDFWFALPDNPHIRTSTFFKVCDLCEEDLRPE